MLTPVGFWAFVIGYALVYTGVSYFMGAPVALTAALGLKGTLQAALPASSPTASSTTASSTTAASTLAGGIQS